MTNGVHLGFELVIADKPFWWGSFGVATACGALIGVNIGMWACDHALNPTFSAVITVSLTVAMLTMLYFLKQALRRVLCAREAVEDAIEKLVEERQHLEDARRAKGV